MRYFRSEPGFTLTEILITVMVVVLALSGMVAMQLGTTKANVQSMNFQRALSYAEELLEEARAAEWQAPCTACCDPTTDEVETAVCVPGNCLANCTQAEYEGPACACNGWNALHAAMDATRSVPRAGAIPGQGCRCAQTSTTVGDPCGPGGAGATALASWTGCDALAAMNGSAGDTRYRIYSNTDTSNACYPPYQQICDLKPPNPTGTIFDRWLEITDIFPPGGIGPVTMRRVTAIVEWQDVISLRRDPSGNKPHRVALEMVRHRQ